MFYPNGERERPMADEPVARRPDEPPLWLPYSTGRLPHTKAGLRLRVPGGRLGAENTSDGGRHCSHASIQLGHLQVRAASAQAHDVENRDTLPRLLEALSPTTAAGRPIKGSVSCRHSARSGDPNWDRRWVGRNAFCLRCTDLPTKPVDLLLSCLSRSIHSSWPTRSGTAVFS